MFIHEDASFKASWLLAHMEVPRLCERIRSSVFWSDHGFQKYSLKSDWVYILIKRLAKYRKPMLLGVLPLVGGRVEEGLFKCDVALDDSFLECFEEDELKDSEVIVICFKRILKSS